MLHTSLESPTTRRALAEQWHVDPCLRIEPFLQEEVSDALFEHLRAQPFTLMATVSPHLSFQYWSFSFVPDRQCDHRLCVFGRWLFDLGARFLSEITSMDLGPPPERMLQSTLYTKGSYLDAHNDYDGQRQLAYIIGLTREPIPEDVGGHLEFLDIDRQHENSPVVRESRPPGWNTLDIFDVRRPVRLHRVPLVTQAVERRAITGWLYQRTEDP